MRATWGIGRPPWLLPFGLIVLGVVIDLVIPGSLLVGAMFAAPMAAAALWTARGTLLTGAASTVTVAALVQWGNDLPWTEAALRLTAVAAVSLLAVAVHGALRRGDLRLASARRIAEAVQLAVLPVPPGRAGGLALAARYQAAHEGARIGGDLYGVQRTPYGVRLLVGDVRGKGLKAVGAVTVVLGAFREAAETEPDLAAVADRIEHALAREGRQGGEPVWPEGFVTAVLAEVPEGSPGSLRIVNRGHPPPLLLSADGASLRALEPRSYALPLGLGHLAGDAEGRDGRTEPVPFPPGSLLLLHTDGVTEARNAEGVFYDPAARLLGHRFAGPGALLDALVADVKAYTGGRMDDDMALLAVMCDPLPPSAPPRAELSLWVTAGHPSA